MPRRSGDSENSRDHNWHRLWERPSKRSHRQRTRLRRLSSDPSHPEESLIHQVRRIQSLWQVIQQTSPLKTSSFASVRIWRQSRKNRQDRWLNCRAVLTIYSKKTITYGLVWKKIGLKMHEGAATLHSHPRLNKIKERSLSF